MRILCIRGENLASLYGPFELPLDAGPIVETGLFSISGPTGAGKSTLMDALCLALFNRTPRLGERGRSVMVGRPQDDSSLLVEANDVRSILSRGAGEGYAEVDFEGVDGGRYRARWSVNRARGRANGRLQQPKMVLTDLGTDEPVEEGLAAMPKRVERLVGYSFDEFKRAVVLPQFEFTAFLKANPDDRAAILERVTGTDVYTRVSIAAHERAAAEDEKLRVITERAGSVRLLTGEERAVYVDRAAALSRTQEEAKTAANAAADALRWHEAAAKLAVAAVEASKALKQATEDCAAGETLRTELQAVDGAQALRPLHDDAVRTARERDEASKQFASAQEGLGAAKGGRDHAAGVEREAARAAYEAATWLEAARPEIARARDLDVGLAEAERRARLANDALAAAQAESQTAEAALAQIGRSIAELESSRERALAWLRDHTDRESLASEWPRWESHLREHASVVTDLSRREAALAAARQAHRSAEARKKTLGRKADELRAGFSRLEQRLGAASAMASKDDPRALKKRADDLADRRNVLKDLATQAEHAATARAARDEAREGARTDSAALESARHEAEVLDKKVIGSEAALTAIEHCSVEGRLGAALSGGEDTVRPTWGMHQAG